MTEKPVATIAISEFKASCHAVLERVRRTGSSIVITRRGVPIAEISPPAPEVPQTKWIGSMVGTARIVGDLVSPIASDHWEALSG